MIDPFPDPAEITRSSGSSFLTAFLFLSRPRRRALEAVYAFCRAADDVADAEGPGQDERRAALDGFQEEVERIFAGRPATALGRALVPALELGVKREDLEAVIDGCRMDLEGREYATFADLEVYCRKVASAVGRMCVAVFGAQVPRAVPYADATGIALQLTNILRDVGEDFLRGRVYLPREDLDRFGLSRESLAPGREKSAGEREALRAFFAFQVERARRFFAESDAVIPREDCRRLLPGEIMKSVYLALLARVERAGPDLPDRRIRMGRGAKALAAFRALVRCGLGLGRGGKP